MKKDSIRSHLKNYSIFQKRHTTINHAFASALSVPDDYSEEQTEKALKILDQDPAKELRCAYCDEPAQTWDHIYGLVKGGKFSGYGHQLGNLIPCCKLCNSAKGNKDWQEFLKLISKDKNKFKVKKERISKYISENMINILPIVNEFNEDIKTLDQIKNEIFELMKKADGIADDIRLKVKKGIKNR